MPTKKAKKVAPPPAPPAPPPAPVHIVPLGTYLNENRRSAIAFKYSERGVWYLTIMTEFVTVEHVSEERFRRMFPFVLPGYPMRRAVRKYHTSFIRRDERAEKVMRALLRIEV